MCLFPEPLHLTAERLRLFPTKMLYGWAELEKQHSGKKPLFALQDLG
jgi:hypothetical protein